MFRKIKLNLFDEKKLKTQSGDDKKKIWLYFFMFINLVCSTSENFDKTMIVEIIFSNITEFENEFQKSDQSPIDQY